MINEEITTEVPEVFRDGDYWLAAHGKIYRENALIGFLDKASGKVIYQPEMHKYMNRVGRLLNKLPDEVIDSLPELEIFPQEEGASTHSSGEGAWANVEVAPVDGSGSDGSVVIPSSGPGGPGGGGYPPDYDETPPPPSTVAPAEPPSPEEPCKFKELSFDEVMRDWPVGAPATDWRGDMNPDFVEWYFKHYPERAKRRYAERGLRPVVQEVLAKLQLSIY